MKVLLTGATGFTGSHVRSLLLQRGMEFRCLVRRSDHGIRDAEAIVGDLGDGASLDRALRGVDALVNTASIGFGHAPGIIAAAERAGVRRAIFISTTAVFTTLNAASKSVRVAAEEAIEQSRLPYTILRPTMIYGTPADRNMIRLIRYLRRWPVLPIVGDGERLQQPVYVGDVAKACIDTLASDTTIRRAYNVSGAAPLTFNEVIDTVARLLGRRVCKLHLPVGPFVGLLQACERIGVRLPVKAEQIQRLNEDKAFPHEDARRDFGYSPLTFEEGIRREIAMEGSG